MRLIGKRQFEINGKYLFRGMKGEEKQMLMDLSLKKKIKKKISR